MIGPVPGDGDAYELDEDDLRPGDQVRKLPKRKPRRGGAVPVRFPPEKTESRFMPRSHRGMGSTAGRRPSVARCSARTIGRRRGRRREHPYAIRRGVVTDARTALRPATAGPRRLVPRGNMRTTGWRIHGKGRQNDYI